MEGLRRGIMLKSGKMVGLTYIDRGGGLHTAGVGVDSPQQIRLTLTCHPFSLANDSHLHLASTLIQACTYSWTHWQIVSMCIVSINIMALLSYLFINIFTVPTSIDLHQYFPLVLSRVSL